MSLSIKEINELLKSKKIKPLDLVLESFELIENNKEYNAFITLNKEEAIKRAKELEDKEVDNILFGIPIAIKDNICTKDLRTTCASKILSNFVPVYDATVVKKIKDANMIIIGKTNMDEFAMGSSNETSYFGPVLNAVDKTKVSGGSSVGSAVSVKLGCVPFSLGSDTGGSIRQPSAFNGLVGLKPTYGRVSRYGLVAFASSLDQIGPISRNVYENALLLNAICGLDENDLTSSETNEDFTRLIGEDISGMKIAVPKFYVSDVINPEIKNRVLEIIEFIKSKGVIVDYVDIKYIEYSVPLYQIIALAEASSNLARYDGVRYGYVTDKKVDNIDELYKYTRSEGFGAEVKRRLMIGSYVLSGKNAKTYYYKALKIRKNISDSFNKILSNYDLIIGPTTTDFAYSFGCQTTDAIKSFSDDLLTIPVNMAGLPSMSMNIGDKKPIGLQIIGNKFDEAKIYKFASYIEKEGGKSC
ncbi:MAG: Asp-tRNA(Asn)/Glu-tRNA(Gln) amidotransferase subunit GatA [bacterium]|nr:Asp-tRNA(Asn)/Glu-tRNA(Gln) amidotransferase subunit GatA [bacterium]